jgi:hypothetical protein
MRRINELKVDFKSFQAFMFHDKGIALASAPAGVLIWSILDCSCSSGGVLGGSCIFLVALTREGSTEPIGWDLEEQPQELNRMPKLEPQKKA